MEPVGLEPAQDCLFLRVLLTRLRWEEVARLRPLLAVVVQFLALLQAQGVDEVAHCLPLALQELMGDLAGDQEWVIAEVEE